MKTVSMPYSFQSKGHYSPAVIHGGLVYVSGQLPINYAGGETLPAGGIEEQTQQVLKTTVYIPDISYWPVVNEIYAKFFGNHKPARSIVPTNALHFGAMIEIEAVAYV